MAVLAAVLVGDPVAFALAAATAAESCHGERSVGDVGATGAVAVADAVVLGVVDVVAVAVDAVVAPDAVVMAVLAVLAAVVLAAVLVAENGSCARGPCWATPNGA